MSYAKSDHDRSESEIRLNPQEAGYTKDTLLFGELLLSKGLLNRRELAEALNEQRRRGGRLGEILVKLKMVSDEDVRCALAEHLATERVHLDGKDIDMDIARLVPEAFAKRFNLVAIDEKDGKILVAMADPLDVIAADTITLKTGREIKPVLSSLREIRQTIEKVYHGSDIDEQQLRDLVEHAVMRTQREGKQIDEELRAKFDQLVTCWKGETRFASTVLEMSTHSAYQQIIGMGQPAVALILESLAAKADHWFWALKAITGEDPSPKKSRGNIKEMTEAWLNWGRAKGYEC